jgi:hypothetical protein
MLSGEVPGCVEKSRMLVMSIEKAVTITFIFLRLEALLFGGLCELGSFKT